MKSKTTTLSRFQHIVIVAALIAPLLSLVSAPAQAVAPTCAQGGVCTVGDTGPGGGKVFYVAPGSDTFACGPDLAARCRYLEAAPNGWSGNSDDPDMTWSSPSNRTTAVTGADETAVGSGYKNSEDIKNQSGNLAASSAAVTARAYSGGGKSDWYLPSKDELNQMCKWVRGQAWVSDTTLCNETGNMNSGAGAAGFTAAYWSSTEVSADKALSISFSIGYTDFTNVGSQKGLFSWQVRPIRAFSPASLTCAQGGVCQLGDIGPGGGMVFYVAPNNGTFTQIDASGSMCTTNCKYLEAAPTSGTNAWTGTYYQWSGNLDTAIGTTGTAIGTGYSNTVKMVTQSATADRAGTISRAYRGPNNLTDWFLPSQDELNELYVRRASVGGFVGDFHWSSSELTENPASSAWFQSFESAGRQLVNIKFSTLYVRPIRAFAPATKVAITRVAVGTQRRTAFTTQPQVTIQYSNNDTATVSSAVVVATVSTGGTLIGTTTATASSGVATFSNLGVDGTIGSTYTITYTAADLTVATATVTLTGTTCDGATFTCQVGDTGPGGGKIFYVAPTTFTQAGATISMCSTWCKYLEVAPSTWSSPSGDPTRTWINDFRQSARAFPEGVYELLGMDGVSIGSGYQLSGYLNKYLYVEPENTAAVAARTYSGGGKRDWYLPARDELTQLYAQRANIGGGFVADSYWSSSEANASTAWFRNFGDGSGGFDFKSGLKYIRPIRAFGTAPTTINVANIVIPAPVTGATPVSSITSNGQYTTAITWSGSPSIFDSSTAYTATVTVTPVAGYTLTGITTDFFRVNGNTPTSVVSPITASILGATGKSPSSIAIDTQGNTYTLDLADGTVTRITPSGISTTLGEVGFDSIFSAIDSSGNIYRSNNSINTVTKITPSGVSTQFGTTGAGPSGIVVDAVGNVYTANGAANTVTKITSDGVSTQLGTTGAGPLGIVVDAVGNVYTSNNSANTVTKITPSGTSTTLGNTGRQPYGIALDSLGNVYTANTLDNTVTKFTITSQGVTTSTLSTTSFSPLNIDVDSIGNIFLTSGGDSSSPNGKVVKISPQGVSSTLYSFPGFVPQDLVVDAAGNVYTADSGNRVIKLSPTNSGVFTYQFPATAAPASPVVYVAPTPVPYLKTLTTPRLNLKDDKLICTPGTYNAGYTLDGVVQGSTTAFFTPSSFTYNILINGIAQTALALTSRTASALWSIPSSTAGSLITCSVTVTANGITNTDGSNQNTAGVSTASTTQGISLATANADYAAALSANSKSYQKALVDNRTQWRSTTEKIRTDYYAERDRIRALPSTKATRALSSAALKAYTAALKKSAADYKASGPAALAAKDAADKAALTARDTAITKANAAYGTAIESIGYGVLIP